MKKLLLILFSVLFILISKAQNVNVEAQIIEVQRTNYSDGALFGDPDPTWISRGYIGGVLQGTVTLDYEEMSGTNWNVGYNGCNGPVPCSIINNGNTSATSFVLGVDAWENDCDPMNSFESGCNCIFGACVNADYSRCTNNSLATINFRTASSFCIANNGGGWSEAWSPWCGNYRVRYAYRWSFRSAPTITAQPVANTSLCMGTTTTLSVAVNNDPSSSVSLGQHYQWQVSNNTSCSGAANWQDIPGATSASFTPPQIAGTRLYRVNVTSNCTANFSSQTTTSNCARVTYNPYDGSSNAPGGFPYGTGDNSPAIQSGVCGSTVLPGSTHVLEALLPPSVGAMANISSYQWAITSGGGSLSASSGTSITYTAPVVPGATVIVLTYIDACGQPNQSVVCTINVGSPSCDMVYVAPGGADVPANGGPSNPYATLRYAIAQRGTRNHIKMANGNYSETQTVELANNLIIEGGYNITSGIWSKSSNSTTNITVNDAIATEFLSSYHYIGFRSNNNDNWKLIDLTISTTNKTGNYGGQRGDSNYGLHISNGSNGYEIIRTSITSRLAGNGGNGTGGGFNGSNGYAGYAGNNGSCDGGHGDYTGTRSGPGSGVRRGGNGGRGGRGGYEGANNGVGGSNGTNGGGGASADYSAGNGGGRGNCRGYGGGSASGSVYSQGGYNGANGASYVSGDRPTNYVYSTFFIPGNRAANGADGGGGGGGAGGGGGGGQGETSCWSSCNDGGGNGGGSGGSGGEGGFGGGGAWGGGGSFAVYEAGSAGVYINSVLTAGQFGYGGNGQNGGTGGQGGRGGYGAGSCTGEVGGGGNGSRGGNGGNGGRGQDGANGISYPLAKSNGTLLNPSTAIANSTTVTINYQNAKICQNSVLNIQKNMGNWGLPTNWNYVRYNNTAVSSEFNNSTNNVDIYTTLTNGTHNLIANGISFASYLNILSARSLPSVTINANDGSALSPLATICNGGTVQLTASSWGTEVEYKWEIFDATNAPNKGLTTDLVFSSTLQTPVTTSLSNIGAADKMYLVRYQVKEECCGWSIPVFTTITVKPDPTGPTALVQDPAAVDVCIGQILTINSPSGVTGGIPAYTYEYYYQNSATSAGFSSSVPSFTAAEGANITQVRVAEDALRGCDASPYYEVEWTGHKDPEAGGVTDVSPAAGIVCLGTDVEVAVTGAQGGVPGTTTDEIEYYIVTPSGGAAPGMGASGTAYSGPITTNTAGDYYFRTRRLSTGLECNTSTWSAWSSLYTVVTPPEGGTPNPEQSLCFNTNASDVTLTGSDGSVVRWEIDNNNAFSSPATISNTTTTLLGAEIDGEIGGSNNVTLYARAVVEKTGCTITYSDTVEIRYNEPKPIVGADATGSCEANNAGTWVNIFDPVTERMICSINDLGQDLGTISGTIYYNGGNAFTVPATGSCAQNQAVLNRSFVINSTNAPTSNVAIRLYFTDDELAKLIDASLTSHSTYPATSVALYDANGCEDNDDVRSINDLFVTQITGATNEDGTFTPGDGTFILHTPTKVGPGDADYGANYVQFFVTSFSEFWIHGSESGTPLPVELLSFTASLENKNNGRLKWVTATEINNRGFEIERSKTSNTEGFEVIGWVDGNGNTTDVRSYTFVDENLANGTYYYRLRQVDFDGQFEYSDVRNIRVNPEGVYIGELNPNPATEEVSVDIDVEADANATVEVYNLWGQMVLTNEHKLNVGSNKIKTNLADFAAGLYEYVITVNNESVTHKLVVNK